MKRQRTQDTLISTPEEIVIYIALFVEAGDLVRLSLTCKDLHARVLPGVFKVNQQLFTKLIDLYNSEAKLEGINNLISKYGKLITELDLSGWGRNGRLLTDTQLSELSNITHLNLSFNENITDDIVSKLTNITFLSLYYNPKITNKSLSGLTNLRSLDLSGNHNITDYALIGLTNLTFLNISFNENITNNCVSRLTNLVSLDRSLEEYIIGGGDVADLTSLSLDAPDDENLVGLITLDLSSFDENIINHGFV